MTTKPTQLQTIKEELLKGAVIDSVEAFERHHITRLSSIIERVYGLIPYYLLLGIKKPL
jgi:sulfite exporter TauE/SafE